MSWIKWPERVWESKSVWIRGVRVELWASRPPTTEDYVRREEVVQTLNAVEDRGG